MKPKQLLLFLTFAGTTIYLSCRKTDRPSSMEINVSNSHRFFYEHIPEQPLVNAARQFVMSENSKYDFVDKLAGNIGFPYWDKSIVATTSQAPARLNLGEEGTVFIPFVPNGDSLVKTTLAITINPGDTSFRFISNWQYHDRANGSMTVDSTAENMAALFMLLQKEVSGHKRFHITDPSLFADLPVPASATGREIVIHEADARTARLSTSTILYCFYGYVCGTPSNIACTGPSGCDYENCPTNQCYATSTCIEFEVEEGTGGGGPVGGGGPGGGPAGGGSGSGGGWNPPDIPCVPTQANNNCGQGWVIVPVPIGGGSATLPNDSTIAANLKKLMLKAQSTADSLHTKAQEDGNERVFTLNRIPDTVIIWKKTGTKHTSSPTLDLNSFAICHTHQEDDPTGGTDKNQCFDGPDIFKLYQNYLDGYSVEVSIVTTRDFYYAAVITDSGKFKNYIKTLCGSQQRDVIKVTLDNLHIDAMDNCACTWQKKSEKGVLAITANSNSDVSGIKIFRSLRSNINFSVLKP